MEALENGYITNEECRSLTMLAKRATGATTKLIIYLRRGT